MTVRQLSIQDLLFANTTLECETDAGVRYSRLVRVGMPRIPETVTKCVFYLYRTPEDARAGRDPQGTGFIVGVPIARFGFTMALYAVTAWHMAVDATDKDDPPAPVIRLNSKEGEEPIVIPLTPADWRYIPDIDVAVAPLDPSEQQDAVCIPVSLFLSRDDLSRHGINVGEDVFMMGLFVDHDGGAKNVPAARFGNISMMPNADALVPQGRLDGVEAFVLDLHSRTGYSGSPVFVYRTFGSDLTVPIDSHFDLEIDGFWRGMRTGSSSRLAGDPGIKLRVNHETIFRFLGLHFAQFPEELEAADGSPITGLSGMTCAIPAWRVLDALNLPEFVQERAEMAKKAAEENRKKPRPEKRSRAGKQEPNPDHREDFKRLLKAAVRPPKSSD